MSVSWSVHIRWSGQQPSISLVGGGKFQITTQMGIEANRDTPWKDSTQRVSWGSRVWEDTLLSTSREEPKGNRDLYFLVAGSSQAQSIAQYIQKGVCQDLGDSDPLISDVRS